MPFPPHEKCGYSLVLDLFAHAPGDRIELRPDDAERIRCHFFITQLADRGLAEAAQSLRDMVEFYSEESMPALPLPPASEKSLPTRFGGSYTATIPPITEG